MAKKVAEVAAEIVPVVNTQKLKKVQGRLKNLFNGISLDGNVAGAAKRLQQSRIYRTGKATLSAGTNLLTGGGGSVVGLAGLAGAAGAAGAALAALIYTTNKLNDNFRRLEEETLGTSQEFSNLLNSVENEEEKQQLNNLAQSLAAYDISKGQVANMVRDIQDRQLRGDLQDQTNISAGELLQNILMKAQNVGGVEGRALLNDCFSFPNI